MARRLRRNYIWLFLILLLAWLLKTTTSVLQASGSAQIVQSTGELFKNAAIGYVPGWVVLILILSFYGWMGYIMLQTPGNERRVGLWRSSRVREGRKAEH